ncbi:hypothetical protein V3481_005414 [Fusarium oxysporum f. sp. vasinfectum]|nr:Prolyl tripeptidyl peptidase [Fusarium oxysporum f. sp. albedinis]
MKNPLGIRSIEQFNWLMKHSQKDTEKHTRRITPHPCMSPASLLFPRGPTSHEKKAKTSYSSMRNGQIQRKPHRARHSRISIPTSNSKSPSPLQFELPLAG